MQINHILRLLVYKILLLTFAFILLCLSFAACKNDEGINNMERPGTAMNAFKLYVRMILSPCYYRHIVVKGKEYAPEAGTPVVFVGNHRNAMCDPLIVETLFSDRDIRWFVRADLFKNRLIGSILKALHLMPMYRMDFDGLETLFDRIKEREFYFKVQLFQSQS